MKDDFGNLPSLVLSQIFSYLDWKSLANALRVNKKWSRVGDGPFWKRLYYNPTQGVCLRQNELCQNAVESVPDPNHKLAFHYFLTHYLEKTFEVYLPEEEKNVVDFIKKCFAYFRGDEEKITIAYPSFRRDEKINYTICRDYLGDWTAEKVMQSLEKVFMVLQQWKHKRFQPVKLNEEDQKEHKILLRAWLPAASEDWRNKRIYPIDFDKLDQQDYKIFLKVLSPLYELTKILAVIFLQYKIKLEGIETSFSTEYAPPFPILTDQRWSHLLTLKEVLAVLAHHPQIAIGFEYEKGYFAQLSKEVTKKYDFPIEGQAENSSFTKERLYFKCINQWCSKTDEKELLKIFLLPIQRGLLLTNEELVSRLSNEIFLELLLDAPELFLPYLFSHSFFIERMQKVLKTLGEMANKLVLAFKNILQTKKLNPNQAGHFACAIFRDSYLTSLLLDNALTEVARNIIGMRDFSDEHVEALVTTNPEAVRRLLDKEILDINECKEALKEKLILIGKVEEDKNISKIDCSEKITAFAENIKIEKIEQEIIEIKNLNPLPIAQITQIGLLPSPRNHPTLNNEDTENNETENPLALSVIVKKEGGGNNFSYN